jgi:DNA-binding FadR family transcriptional regulator
MTDGFKRIQQPRLSTHIFRQVMTRLVRGDIKPGERLPPELELASQLGVSRAGVREALRMLEQAGVVAIRRGKRGGAFVRENSHASIIEGLALMYQLDQLTREELAEARHFVEGTTARLAAQRATHEDLERMKQALEPLNEDPLSPQAFIRSNAMFHAAIAHAAHNRVLLIMLQSVQGLIDRGLATARLEPYVISRAMADHRRIYDAIAARKPNRAEAAILEHIESFEDEFREIYSSHEISYWPMNPENS